jgi:hypothetical protein
VGIRNDEMWLDGHRVTMNANATERFLLTQFGMRRLLLMKLFTYFERRVQFLNRITCK